MSIPKTGNRRSPNEWPIDIPFARTKSSDNAEHIGLVSKYLLVDPAGKQLRLYAGKPEDLDEAYCVHPNWKELENAFISQMSIAERSGEEPAKTHFTVQHWGLGPTHEEHKWEASPTSTGELSNKAEFRSADASSTGKQSPAFVELAHRTTDEDSPDAKTVINAPGQYLPAGDYSVSKTSASPQKGAQCLTVRTQSSHAASIAVEPGRRLSSASDSSFVPTALPFDDFVPPADIMDFEQTQATYSDDDYLPEGTRNQWRELTNWNPAAESRHVSVFGDPTIPPSSQLAYS